MLPLMNVIPHQTLIYVCYTFMFWCAAFLACSKYEEMPRNVWLWGLAVLFIVKFYAHIPLITHLSTVLQQNSGELYITSPHTGSVYSFALLLFFNYSFMILYLFIHFFYSLYYINEPVEKQQEVFIICVLAQSALFEGLQINYFFWSFILLLLFFWFSVEIVKYYYWLPEYTLSVYVWSNIAQFCSLLVLLITYEIFRTYGGFSPTILFSHRQSDSCLVYSPYLLCLLFFFVGIIFPYFIYQLHPSANIDFITISLFFFCYIPLMFILCFLANLIFPTSMYWAVVFIHKVIILGLIIRFFFISCPWRSFFQVMNLIAQIGIMGLLSPALISAWCIIQVFFLSFLIGAMGNLFFNILKESFSMWAEDGITPRWAVQRWLTFYFIWFTTINNITQNCIFQTLFIQYEVKLFFIEYAWTFSELLLYQCLLLYFLWFFYIILKTCIELPTHEFWLSKLHCGLLILLAVGMFFLVWSTVPITQHLYALDPVPINIEMNQWFAWLFKIFK